MSFLPEAITGFVVIPFLPLVYLQDVETRYFVIVNCNLFLIFFTVNLDQFYSLKSDIFLLCLRCSPVFVARTAQYHIIYHMYAE